MIAFLIDTGADRTTLSPQDAIAVFGRDYFLIADRRGASLEVTGIGRALATEEQSVLLLRSTTGQVYRLDVELQVIEPEADSEGGWRNWEMPSLLGRDVLRLFEFRMSYEPDVVELIVTESRRATGVNPI